MSVILHRWIVDDKPVKYPETRLDFDLSVLTLCLKHVVGSIIGKRITYKIRTRNIYTFAANYFVVRHIQSEHKNIVHHIVLHFKEIYL